MRVGGRAVTARAWTGVSGKLYPIVRVGRARVLLARLVVETFCQPLPPLYRVRRLHSPLDCSLASLIVVPVTPRRPPARRYNAMPPNGVAERIVVGHDDRPVVCPRCAGPLGHEPAFAHCGLCGRLFPIRGASVADQMAYEQVSGLRTREPAWLPASRT